MDSLYKVGNDWYLNGGKCPSNKFRLSTVGLSVALLGGSTGDLIDEYKEVTEISKNVGGDKYATYEEFYTATELFYTKSQKTTGYPVLSDERVGYDTIDKFGINQTITTGSAPEDLWEIGGIYPDDIFGTAPILYLSSSHTDDNQDTYVRGLDINGYEVEQIIALDGQNNVNLTTPLWKVYVMENYGATKNQGNVFCHKDPATTTGTPSIANTRAAMMNSKGRTLMAIYTIPMGKVGLFFRGEVGIKMEGNAAALAENADFHIETKAFGKSFTVEKSLSVMVSQGYYKDFRPFNDPVPSLTDIKLVVDSVSATMGVWGTFAILLVDENKFSQAYLTSIGQVQ